ncbi:MAG: DUF4142 domain-containing protein [Bacteroidetes bacterium]|nr:DUF4142 domain-containing protein [Bacteroidota bacterium]
MNSLKKITCITALGILTVLNTACSDNKDSKEIAEQANEEKFDGKEEKAVDHLVDAYSGNMYEIKAAENACMNAATPEVKKLAMMMMEAHGKMNVEIEKLATSKSVTLPLNLTEDQRKDIEQLNEKTGMDYDKAYVSKMKDKHEDALKMLEGVSEKCDDAEIKAWAQKSAPVVGSHLEMVKTTQDNIKDKK